MKILITGGWFWVLFLLAISCLSFHVWLVNLRRYRQIRDLPTSKIASAAQGYVELFGRCESINGKPILSHLGRIPCCWNEYMVQRFDKSSGKWKVIKEGSSNAQFLLVDDTGQCVISPQGADITTNRRRSWNEGPDHYTEWLLLPNDILYAIGDFTTTEGRLRDDVDEITDIGLLIDTWKLDRKTLHERFDLNRDRIMDQKEWEFALLEAARELRKTRSEQVKTMVEGVHRMHKPKDGRPFLLANEMPDWLGQSYRWWGWFSLLISISTGFVAVVLSKLFIQTS